MSDLYYFFGSMLGLAVGITMVSSLGRKRRLSIPLSVSWLCVIAGAGASIYALSHSTGPSSARRITVTGPTDDCVQYTVGKSFKTSFRISPPGAQPLRLETNIIVPSWGAPEIFNGRIFRVVYLDDPERSVRDEAIDITILSGKHAGFHDAKDARWTGSWLGIPVGVTIAAIGYFVIRLRRSDLKSAEADEEP